VRDVLPALRRWADAGIPAATVTVVATERSAPRDPGATLALNANGEVLGSVTGGCVEPAVIVEAEEVLNGGEPRLRTYGIADEEAFEVGLPCGGTVHVFVDRLDPALLGPLADAIEHERPVALAVDVSGPDIGRKRLIDPDADAEEEVQRALTLGESGLLEVDGRQVFVDAFVPRPAMYVFGAVDHASAVARIGRFLGYRVTVCDARASFVTPQRFPDVDELVVDWPDRFLARSPVDERTAIVVLTHEHKFDVPALKVALGTNAGYIGAMGSKRTTAVREERLRAEGVSDEQLARVHAPIGLSINARSPEEVAVAIAGEIVAVRRHSAIRSRPPEVFAKTG
jgi:xanthine dehydrogenase accessory factor